MSHDAIATYGQSIPDLIAEGENIKWYTNRELTDLVHSGNSFETGTTLPGVYEYFATQTIGCESEPTGVTLTINSPSPSAENCIICYGDLVPDLTASGSNIKWYSDAGLTNLIQTGNNFTTGKTIPGIYTYYVTQSINGYESLSQEVSLTIKELPSGPDAEDLSVCQNAEIPPLHASGLNIKWYIDASLGTLLQTGNSFNTGQTQPGIFPYYITQTYQDCESNGTMVNLIIYEKPELLLGKDESINQDDSLILDAGPAFNNYLWNNGTQHSSVVLKGESLGSGTHTIWLTVTDHNGCMASDTLIVTVMKESGITSIPGSEGMEIHPNPTTGSLDIRLLKGAENHVQISVLNENGIILIHEKFQRLNKNDTVTLDLFALPDGVYVVLVITDKVSFHQKIIKTGGQ